jgi:gliding motility-associated-like protein
LTAAGNGATYYNGSNKTGGVISPTATFTSTKIVYVYKESGTVPTNCFSEKTFTIFIGTGSIVAPADVNSCDPYTLPTSEFAQYRTEPNGGGTLYPVNAIINTPGVTTVYFFVPGQTCLGNLSFTVTVTFPALAPMPDIPSSCDSYILPIVAAHPSGKYYTQPLGVGPARLQGATIYTLGVQTIYFYVKAAVGTCYLQDDFQLTIFASPPISQRPIEIVRCNQPFIVDVLQFGSYYEFAGGPNTPNNPALVPPLNLTTNTTGLPYKEIFVYAGSSNPLNPCFQEYSRKIYFVNTTVAPIADLIACDTYTLPAIVGPGDYYTMTGGPLVSTKITLPYTISATTTLYVYAEDNNRVACSDQDAFTVTIVKTPNLNPVAAVSVCDTYIVPQFNNPMFTFTTTNPGTVIKFYKNPGGPAANPNPVTDIYTPGQVLTNTNPVAPLIVTIYPYTETVPCFDDEPFVVTINRTPTLAPVANATYCDSHTLPVLAVGKYYTTAAHTTELTGAQLTLTAPSTTVYVYAATATVPNCEAAVQSFVVTIVTTPVISAILPVASCDTYAIPAYNNPMFSSTNPITKFYKNAGGPAANPLGSDEYAVNQSIGIPTGSTTPYVFTIYAYAAVGSVPCFDDEPFVVTINKTPTLAPVANATYCDSYTLPILAVGKYYTTAAHTTELTGAQLTLTAPSTTVYVYAATGTVPNCEAAVQSFVVTIVTTPVVSAISPVASCDTYTIPAYNNAMFSSTSPITKFYKNAGGPAANLSITDEYAVNQSVGIPTGSTSPYVFTVYAYSAVGSVPCFDDEPFVVTINKTPIIVVAEVANRTICDSYTLPNLTVGNYVDVNGVALTSLFINATSTVYVHAEIGTNPICMDDKNFVVTIITTPFVNAITPVTICDAYVIPAYANPMFSSTSPITKFYKNAGGAAANPLVSDEYFVGQNIPNVNNTPLVFTIYAYAGVGSVPCYDDEPFVVTINKSPVILAGEVLPITKCSAYALPALTVGSYVDAFGNPLTNLLIAATQTVYVYAETGIAPNICVDNKNFLVTINSQPIANDASDTVCDIDSSPYDGITTYDLTTLNSIILGATQLPADYTVTFYSDFNRTVLVLNPTQSTLAIVYAFVTINLSPTCPAPAVITINVIPTPNPKLDVPPICIDSETGLITNSVIESGYNSLQYNIVWTQADGTVVSNNQTFSTDVPGDYFLNVASNTVTSCAAVPVPFTIIESAKPAVTPPISFTTTGWFTNNQTITVNATPFVGNGDNFVYSLDGSTPQVSNIFANVGAGAHEITVIDINGCGSRALPIPVELITSPPAFTPNGDGINDSWDIKGDLAYTSLNIFDRFGRLLKQLSKNSGGWDGQFNSQALPADDYWFSINYFDSSGVPREFRSHFSLIR